MPVLIEAFNTGLEPHDPEHVRLLRQEYANWQESLEKRKADPVPHHNWIKFVLTKTLDLDERVLSEGQAIPQTLHVEVPEHRELLRPSIVVNDPGTNKARLLIQIYPRSQDLTGYVANSSWKASPDTRMTQLLHGAGVRLGLVTNGEHWMLVHAPKGETSGFASWYASLWLEEPITLRAFRSLLSASRFFNVTDDQTLEALLAKSASNQQEVTDQLGYQVRRAVEVLIHSLDRADQDFGRELLSEVAPEELYESALTVMMRLVFLFCAEERELIPGKPFPVYEQNYSISTISKQLRELADLHAEELLERRFDSWPRLLAAFRAVYGGLRHDDIHLPAYGGNLFNPDRFPFLEGRKRGTTWKKTQANPLPVNSRTVLHLLEALQLLKIRIPGGGPGEARRISFRALDIEQIGHVYEGLLDHTAKRAAEPYLGLIGTRDKEPEIPLAKLEELLAKGEDDLVKFLKEETGKSESALRKSLKIELDQNDTARFRTACQMDDTLWKRVEPLAGLVRRDSFGYPVVIPKGSVFVTAGTDRRSSGTHYTPRSLTEPIVQYTLEPLVYVGPAEGKPKAEWKLKSARELIELKICDMACGSGAFLVQAARYMAERLLEAWTEDGESWNVDREPWTDEEGATDGDSIVSGFGGLEAGDGFSSGMLPRDQSISERGTLRDDKSDSALGCVDSSEHRRGAGSGTHEGIPQSPEYRSGISDGSTDPSDVGQSSWIAQRRETSAPSADLRTDQPDALPPSSSAGKKALKQAFILPRTTPHGSRSTGSTNEELIPSDPAERKTYAMRIIAQRCLYGVDKNPLAVEMAKLSLWLLTLAKDKPFEFLDHTIRCGDSLVGLHSIDQLRHYSLKPDADDAVLFKGPLDSAVDEAINLRLKLEDMPANSVDDVQRQEKLLIEANEKIARLRCAADSLVAAEFWGENAKDKLERVRHAAVKSGHYVEKGPTTEFEQVAAKERRGQTMFHWPLEFPEVIVKRGGFDAFVGNPPFYWGMRISTTLGPHYLTFLEERAERSLGTADLCAHFLRRSGSLIRATGDIGLILVDTIAQGDTREVGLAILVDRGFTIINAVPTQFWPGSAGVKIARICLYNGEWLGKAVLEDSTVERINSRLHGEEEEQPTFDLVSNSGRSFVGHYLMGQGFVISDRDATQLLAKEPQASNVVFEYIRGEDINQLPTQKGTDRAINFSTLSLDECQTKYPLTLQRIRELVKPERERQKVKTHGDKWWQYARPRPALEEVLKRNQQVIVQPFTSKYLTFTFVGVRHVFAHPLVVIDSEDYSVYGVLQSSYHDAWVRKYASKMGDRIRYASSDCFENYPFPLLEALPTAKESSQLYYAHRQSLLGRTDRCLTDIYNRFHDPDKCSADIQKLRDLHVEMDRAVAAAYGWTDLELGHGFHETKQGVRFTISEPARREVLQRLLKLNHERYAEEEKQGLHGKKGAARKATSKKKAASKTTKEEATLFDFGEDNE